MFAVSESNAGSIFCIWVGGREDDPDATGGSLLSTSSEDAGAPSVVSASNGSTQSASASSYNIPETLHSFIVPTPPGFGTSTTNNPSTLMKTPLASAPHSGSE